MEYNFGKYVHFDRDKRNNLIGIYYTTDKIKVDDDVESMTDVDKLGLGHFLSVRRMGRHNCTIHGVSLFSLNLVKAKRWCLDYNVLPAAVIAIIINVLITDIVKGVLKWIGS